MTRRSVAPASPCTHSTSLPLRRRPSCSSPSGRGSVPSGTPSDRSPETAAAMSTSSATKATTTGCAPPTVLRATTGWPASRRRTTPTTSSTSTPTSSRWASGRRQGEDGLDLGDEPSPHAEAFGDGQRVRGEGGVELVEDHGLVALDVPPHPIEAGDDIHDRAGEGGSDAIALAGVIAVLEAPCVGSERHGAAVVTEEGAQILQRRPLHARVAVL